MEYLTTALDFISSAGAYIPDWLAALLALALAARGITALTPTKTDDKILNAIIKVLSALALNFGNHKKDK